jgi:hypothetical protein
MFEFQFKIRSKHKLIDRIVYFRSSNLSQICPDLQKKDTRVPFQSKYSCDEASPCVGTPLKNTLLPDTLSIVTIFGSC